MRKLLLILLITINISSSWSQTIPSDSNKCKVDKVYFKSLATDFTPLIISPIHWSKGEWIGAGAVIGSAAILYTQDKAIADFWQRNQTEGLDKANEYFFDPLGKMYYTIPLMGAFYL
jgi:hypothetical protein